MAEKVEFFNKLAKMNPVRLREISLALAQRDEVIADIIEKHGIVDLTLRRNYFEAIVRSILSQQLSAKAAETIKSRLYQLLPNGTCIPRCFEKLTQNDLRAIGISNQKANFILEFARTLTSNPTFFEGIEDRTDHEVVNHLVGIKGVGEWTAQMFLIFSLGRLNVLPVQDVGFQRSIQLHYGLRKKPSDRKLQALKRLWNPYTSIAAIYLWKAIDAK